MRIYKAVYRPILTYGCESWVLNKKEKKYIEKGQLEWWGHLMRLPNNTPTRKIWEARSYGKRKRKTRGNMGRYNKKNMEKKKISSLVEQHGTAGSLRPSAVARVGQAVNLAVERFVTVGETIADDYPEVRQGMYEACKEARQAAYPRVNDEDVVKLTMLKEVYGNECLSRTQVFEWFKRFKEGRETTEDDPRLGQPSMSKTDENIEKIDKPIREDRRLSIRGIADITGIDKRMCSPGLLETVTLKGTIFENMEAVKAKATEVLNQLTEADFEHCFPQWKRRMERCRDGQGGVN
ncbi:hypothetical protein NQ318_002582 [Aromia moschata]|uniref:Mos1 transposase HTH domain-containing protein n=1 Tax=Aromia moschata TaxID=1265417 RepID=A0AAV8Y5K2_9CUCU|nr:hypothetical protein NQ318_002582 [Aromia moschata]